MKLKLLVTGAIAAVALSGCATYETSGRGPGGYYQGRPQVRYYDSYGYPAGAYGSYYGSYGSSYYHDRNPYYGYYNPYYPYYRPHHPPPRPDHGHGHGHRPPAGSGAGGNRPAPWRDPTRGAWRDHGEQPMVPGQGRPTAPGAQPYRSVRPQNSGTMPRMRPAPPRIRPDSPSLNQPGTTPPSMPRVMPRSRSERPANTGGPRIQPRGGRVRVIDP